MSNNFPKFTKRRKRISTNLPSREDLAWVAGIMDGEGHLNVKEQGRPYPRLKVGQSSNTGVPQMLIRLQKLFPFGRIYSKTTNYLGAKPVYSFNVNGYEAIQFIVAGIWEWLGDVKRAQAKIVLQEYQIWHASV